MLIRPGSLQFPEYLKQLPPAWVIEHFFSDAPGERKILSSAMIDDCARQFAVVESLHHRYLSLGSADRLRCAQMYLMGTSGIAASAANGLDDPIVASFLGYAARDQAGKLRVFGFESFEAGLREHFTTTLLVAGESSCETAVSPGCRWRCLNDISMTASLAMQHLLLKKRSGKLAVAALQAIRKLVHSGEVHKAEDVEAVAGAITRYGVEHGFFVEDEKEFILNTAVYTDWQSLTIEDRMGEVISFVIKQCSGWNIDLLRAVCTAAGARWISMAALPEEEAGPVREVLLVLQFAGVLELRKHLAGVVFQQVPETAAGAVQPDGRVVIMADFTVVAAQECDPDVLFECAGFCKVNSLDRVYHGTIDRGILVEALGAGIKGDRVLSFLKQWNAPENVIASVREWIREFNRLSLSTGPLLLCAEAAVAGQIAASELLLPWLERLDVNSVFRIKPGGERAVRDIVRKLGFDERMPQWECEPPDVAIGADEFLAAGEDPPRWNLVVDQEPFSAQAGPAIRGSKYGAEMKTLELSEVVQVIDYAILTGQRLVISYEGSPYVRRGTYTVIPLMSGKGVEPMLDAELERTGSRKQFYIKKIGAVGVIPQ